jgi:hypothetical protein
MMATLAWHTSLCSPTDPVTHPTTTCMLQVVGAANVFGDPVRLVHHLGLGVWSFLAIPAAGETRGAKAAPTRFILEPPKTVACRDRQLQRLRGRPWHCCCTRCRFWARTCRASASKAPAKARSPAPSRNPFCLAICSPAGAPSHTSPAPPPCPTTPSARPLRSRLCRRPGGERAAARAAPIPGRAGVRHAGPVCQRGVRLLQRRHQGLGRGAQVHRRAGLGQVGGWVVGCFSFLLKSVSWPCWAWTGGWGGGLLSVCRRWVHRGAGPRQVGRLVGCFLF